MFLTWLSVGAVTTGYLVGSFPTAWLVVRYLVGKKDDIRLLGDGNVGATNLGRLFGVRWGIVAGIVDILKGFALVSAFDLLAEAAGIDQEHVWSPGILAGAAGIAGHIWSVWIGFRGGRGAATAIGVAGAVFTTPMLWLTLPAALILLVTRNTSITFCAVYYPTLICAKVAFDADWAPILGCGILSFPVIFTDPRLRPFVQRSSVRRSMVQRFPGLRRQRQSGLETKKRQRKEKQ